MRDFDIPSRVVPLANRLIPRYFFTPDPYDETPYRSYLGTEVWSPLEFMKTSGTRYDNSQNIADRADTKGEVLLRIDTCLIRVDQYKLIVKTPIPGKQGDVKEYISDGDFLIDIQGKIVSQYPLLYPKEEVELFIELMKLPKAIPVASEFLNFFQIHSIVVERYTMHQNEGSRNEVTFYIQALSDLAEEIKINPNKGL